MVRFLRPRKSIFSRPIASTSSMKYWVITWPSLLRCRGTSSSRGSAAITTPAAWTPNVLLVPSMRRARSTQWRTFGSFSYFSRNSGTGDSGPIISASLAGLPRATGISLASRSASP